MIVVLAEGHGNVAVALCGLWEGLTNIIRAMIINRDCVRVWAQPLAVAVDPEQALGNVHASGGAQNL